MTTVSAADTESLIASLDPDRDYGERTYEQVVAEIRAGTILIFPGQKLPMLRYADKPGSVKGTGQPPQTGVTLQQQMLQQFREMSLDDMPEFYAACKAGWKSGDPRWGKVFADINIGKIGELRGGEAIAEAFAKVVESLSKPEERRVVIDG